MLVCQRTSNLDFSGCFDFGRTATAVNDVEDFNTFRFDTVDDQVSAMLQVSVDAGFSWNETTDGMMEITTGRISTSIQRFSVLNPA